MKRNFLFTLFLIFTFVLFISCKGATADDDESNAETNTTSKKVYSYSYYFRIDGYYIRYDGVHYLVHLNTLDDVRTIIKYYYPDCFDVQVYDRNCTPQCLPYLRGTWKSYIDSDVLRNGPFS